MCQSQTLLLPLAARLVRQVFAGCCQPLLGVGPSRRCSACLSPRAWTPIPAALEVHIPVSSLEASAFPPLGRVGAQHLIHALRLRRGPTFGSAVIPLCSGPRFCSPPRSLLPQGNTAALGSRDLLLPSRTRFVTSSCIGYASRLNRVIAGRGLSPH